MPPSNESFLIRFLILLMLIEARQLLSLAFDS